MTIQKDPEDLPSEIIEFEEVFDDINTPEIWVSKNKNDLEPKLIVLDGHSTILTYTQGAEDLKWEAFNEIGQYKYTAEQVGDGIMRFPHTFYVEFSIELSKQVVDVSADFDGSSIKAIVMPLKDVSIENFIEILTGRISSVCSSVLKPSDSEFTVVAGETLHIPDSILDKLSLKLALLGINLSQVKVKSIADKPAPAEDEVVEETFEPPAEGVKPKIANLKPTKDKKKRKKKKKAIPKKPEEAPPAEPTTPPPTAPPVAPTPPPAAVAEKVKGPEGPPPAIPGAKAKPAKRSTTPTTPTPPPTTTPPSTKEAVEKQVRAKKEAAIDDMLMAKGMDDTESLDLRHTHATWFERMNPSRSYPLTIKISTTEMKAKRSSTNVMTGEKLSEHEETMMVKADDNYVDVIPEFAGCIVVPSMVTVDISKPEVTARFHVTPLAIGMINARIVFKQAHETIHSMDLQTKVIRHQISKWTAIGGSIVGFLPAVLAFATGKSPGTLFEEGYEALGVTGLANLNYWLPGGIFVIATGIAAGLRYIQRPIQQHRSMAFSK